VVIEWLKFRVPESLREAFIRIWIDPDASEVMLVIRWKNQQAWEAVPKAKIAQLEKQMEELTMPLIESRHYQVRKFSH
jgi:hypothetical protein